MIQFMNIAAGDPADNAITQEVKIRVWWTLFMADNWCCSSLGLPRQMKDYPRPARLPLDEGAFCALTPHQPASVLESCGDPGLWAHMVTLVEFFAPIQKLNRRIVQDKDLQQSQIEQDTSRLAQQLEDWQDRLPANACMSEINLLSHAGRGTGGPFLALHLGFHHYATLLYYQYLDTQFTPTTQSFLFAARCKYHARSYSSLLARGRQQTRCEAVYPTVGQMTIVSSSVLLHTLLFGTQDELLQSRHCLQTNFEALLDLAQYWPFVEIMVLPPFPQL
ncbi:hypothetical protein N7540_005474 [Penicillium herquei]|nr:hypothetical protein N7540_005474 [Penicillium herquei]